MSRRKRLEALEQRSGPTVYEVWRQCPDGRDLFYFGTEWTDKDRSMTGDELTAYVKANPNVQMIRVIYERVPLP